MVGAFTVFSRDQMARHLLFLCLFCVLNASFAQIFSALYDEETSNLVLKEGFYPNSVAVANFTDDIHKTG